MDMRGFKHGLRYTVEYQVWIRMRQRCNNTNSKDYPHYGGRGITICPEWDDPVQFVTDMGLRPTANHELDRIDNNKGYSKENCRWVTHTPQMQNTRISKRWFVFGVEYASLSAASKVLGTTPSRVKGWCEGRSDGGYHYPPKPNCWSEKRYI